jgi:Undecaprenyl-phosphate galactose phosphotransferase WbaP
MGVEWLTKGSVHSIVFYNHATVPLLLCAIYLVLGLYPGVGLPPVQELRLLSRGTTLAFMLLLVAASSPIADWMHARSMLVVDWVLLLVAVPLMRALLRVICARRGWWGCPVVVMGPVSTTRTVIKALQRQSWLGLKPVGLLDDEPESRGRIRGVPVLGAISQGPKIARDWGVRYAIVAMPGIHREKLLDLIDHGCQGFTHVLVIPNLVGLSSLWVTTREVGGVLGLEVRCGLSSRTSRLAKRGLDLLLTIPITLMALPLLALITLLIKLDSPGAVVFAQKRPGVWGKPFKIFKFRTMHVDAAERMKHLTPAQKAEFAQHGKIRHDPRVTRVGHWLRRFSLDELPQLWNVLRGDMSLVGPRPYLKSQLKQLRGYQKTIFRVQPGLTGIWQVSGRSKTSFCERLQMDVYYVRNWSVWLDVSILARTGWALIRGTGAY